MDLLNARLKPLSAIGDKVPQIKDFARNAGIESGVIVAAAGAVLSIVTLCVFGATILTLAITVLYPAAKSIQALETQSTDDDKEWLTYWIIFGIFTLLDDFAGFLLSMIPYYFWIKLAFFVYLFAPMTKGSQTIYNTVVKPLLDQYKDKIEGLISDIKGSAADAVSQAKKEALKQVQDPKNFARAAEVYSSAQSEINKLE
jgi:receptor expression-enhancing protein 5/6